jgi:hypothetical protein
VRVANITEPFGCEPNAHRGSPELHQRDIRESSWVRFSAAVEPPCPRGQLTDSLRICTALLTRRSGRLNIKLRQNFSMRREWS